MKPVHKKKNAPVKALIFAIFVLFSVVQLYPLVFLFFMSLKDNNEIFGGNIAGLPQNWHWENYKSAFRDGNIGLYLFNSVFVTFTTILFTIILASMVAYAITRMKLRSNRFVKAYFSLGMMIPLHAVLLPVFIILRDLKMLSTYQALIIPYVAFALPLAIYVLSNFFASLPIELEESACLDGCGLFRAFVQIILPLITPAIATVSIFTFLSTWNEMMFAITYVSKNQFRTLTVGIMQMVGQYTTNWGGLAAGLVVATIPTILMYLLMSNQIESGMVADAVKG